MKSNRKILLGILGLILVCVVIGVIAGRTGNFTIMLPIEHKIEFTSEKIEQFPLWLNVSGNLIVDEDGQAVILKGVMPPDPSVLNRRGKFNREFFADIRDTNVNVIRIPVHPEEWVKDEDYLWRYLFPIVSWAGEMNMYVIIDWHYIGNVSTGTGPQMPDIDPAPKDLTLDFWDLTANYFRDCPNVIFEIFNEPQSIKAEDWRSNAMEIIQTIRDQKANQIIIVGGLDFGKDLSWVMEDPIIGENIVYASHIYPVHSSNKWEYWFGEVVKKYPVLITEWGFMDENRNAKLSYLAGDETSYGIPFLRYLDEHKIGWVACWYDDKWMPAMFTEGWKGYTHNGDFIIRELRK